MFCQTAMLTRRYLITNKSLQRSFRPRFLARATTGQEHLMFMEVRPPFVGCAVREEWVIQQCWVQQILR